MQAPQCIRDHADCSARGHDYRLAMASPAGLTHSPAEELLTLHFAVRQRNLEQVLYCEGRGTAPGNGHYILAVK